MTVQASRPTATLGMDVPGALLLHPAALAAIALFVVNDHVLDCFRRTELGTKSKKPRSRGR